MARIILGSLLASTAIAWSPCGPRSLVRARRDRASLFSASSTDVDEDLKAKRAANKEKKALELGFIMGELRPYAMSLHTREQAPKEGKAKPKRAAPIAWAPSATKYLQFLVDSREVYSTLEDIVGRREDMASLRATGLERVKALDKDIVWLAATRGLLIPSVGESGALYAAHLRELSSDPAMTPKLLNHWYNYYFAHTAGGRMIGAKLSEALFAGKTLEFYQWEGDVKELLGDATKKFDEIANKWTREEKDAALAETGDAFKFGGSMLSYLK